MPRQKPKAKWLSKALKLAFQKGREFHKQNLLPDGITENEGDALQLAFCAGMLGWPCKMERLIEIGEQPKEPPIGGHF
jgi:hypothetical protein